MKVLSSSAAGKGAPRVPGQPLRAHVPSSTITRGLAVAASTVPALAQAAPLLRGPPVRFGAARGVHHPRAFVAMAEERPELTVIDLAELDETLDGEPNKQARIA